MKKLVCVFIVFLFSFCLCSCTSGNAENENEPILLAPNGDYEHELFNNCYVYGGSINNDYLQYNGEIVLKGSFYKYAASSDRYVAIHYMELSEVENNTNDTITFSMDIVKVNKDCFVLFDAENQNKTEFNSIESFNSACQKLGVNFEHWYYCDVESNKIDLTENCYIEDAGKYRGQVLFVNDLPLFEGAIDSYSVIDGNKVAFEFKLVNSDFGPEFNNRTNQSLSLSEFSTSQKYHVSGLLYYDVIYSSYILLDTSNNQFVEYKSKNDIDIVDRWISLS